MNWGSWCVHTRESRVPPEIPAVQMTIGLGWSGLSKTTTKFRLSEKIESCTKLKANEFIFKVENMEELVEFNDDEKKAIISFELGINLVSIAYSTMRGVIHTRTQGTVLEGIIIPVIDPKLLLQPYTNQEIVSSKKAMANG